MFDASTVGLLCAISVVFGVLLGLWHSHHYMGGSISTAEVDRRTAPPGSPARQVDVE